MKEERKNMAVGRESGADRLVDCLRSCVMWGLSPPLHNGYVSS